jgi:filamentous hemagglutinin family protein
MIHCSDRSSWGGIGMKAPYLLRLGAIAPGLLAFLLSPMAAIGQISAAPDGTNTLINRTGDTFNINGGTPAGSNLFHSFQQFGLNPGQTANFLSHPAIQNILGRVTGGNASVIHGQIQVTGSNANLYLVNPAGIVFGANASLNVPASFVATTANGIGIGNGWFNATGGNNYAALTGQPSGYAFTTPQPGAIINAGNLAVGQGQNVTLLGGTVINTGTVSAPGGTVTIAAVPGENLVRVTQAGTLLTLVLPTETRSAINPATATPLSLPALLTGGNLESATGIRVENGVAQLTGSGTPVTLGDVVAKTIQAQTATLSAANNVTLVESQAQTTGDLTIRANNTVWVRDSIANPVTIRAGGNLTIQGDRGIDILALNHPQPAFQSGGNMSLVSDGIVSGDAHFATGGSFAIRNLAGGSGNVISLYDPIISADGDVVFGDYTGVALKVEARGSITVNGTITITGPDTTLPVFEGWTLNGNVRLGAVPLTAEPLSGTASAILRTPFFPATASSVSTTFTAGAGDTIAFNWNFVTTQFTGTLPADRDRAVVVITPPGGGPTVIPLADVSNTTGLSNVPGLFTGNNTGTQTFSTTAPVAGTYTLEVRVEQVGGVTGGSGLVVANVAPRPLAVSDRSVIADNSALIMRAGVPTLENAANVPALGVPTLGTNFTSPGTTAASANITVTGNIAVQAAVPQGSGPVILSAPGAVTVGATPATGNITTDGGSVGLFAGGNITARNINTGGLSEARGSSAVLRSTGGDIVVRTIDAGGGGIDVNAAGSFRATGANSETFFDIRLNNPSLIDYLVSLGYSRDQLIAAGVPSRASFPVSVIARPGVGTAPISIRTGNGAQTIAASSRINIQVDSNQPFVLGPAFTANTTFVPQNPANNVNPFDPVTNPNGFNPAAPFIFTTNSSVPLTYPSDAFPANASGTVGAIAVGAGTDAGLVSSFQNRTFTPITPAPTSGGSTGTTSPTVQPRLAVTGTEVSTVIQQDARRSTQDRLCEPTGNTATVSEARSTTVVNPCTTATDEQQILKVLGADGQPQPR